MGLIRGLVVLLVAPPEAPKLNFHFQPPSHRLRGALTPVAGRNSQAQLSFQAVAAGLRVKELGLARKLLGTGGGDTGPAGTGPLEEQRPGEAWGSDTERHIPRQGETDPDSERPDERDTESVGDTHFFLPFFPHSVDTYWAPAVSQECLW